jgi:hypothetical protein
MVDVKIISKWAHHVVGEILKLGEAKAAELVAQGFAEIVTPSPSVAPEESWPRPLTELPMIADLPRAEHATDPAAPSGSETAKPRSFKRAPKAVNPAPRTSFPGGDASVVPDPEGPNIPTGNP